MSIHFRCLWPKSDRQEAKQYKNGGEDFWERRVVSNSKETKEVKGKQRGEDCTQGALKKALG